MLSWEPTTCAQIPSVLILRSVSDEKNISGDLATGFCNDSFELVLSEGAVITLFRA